MSPIPTFIGKFDRAVDNIEESGGGQIIGATTILTTVVTIILVARLYARKLRAKAAQAAGKPRGRILELDDYFILAAWVSMSFR